MQNVFPRKTANVREFYGSQTLMLGVSVSHVSPLTLKSMRVGALPAFMSCTVCMQ